MSWSDRVSALPVLLPLTVPADGQCIDERFGTVSILATHTFAPVLGVALMFSLTGPPEDVAAFGHILDDDMGPPLDVCQPPHLPRVWMRSYMSPCLELPAIPLHDNVNVARINEICAQHGLDPECTRLVHEILITRHIYAHDARNRVLAFSEYLRRCNGTEREKGVIAALDAIRAAS